MPEPTATRSDIPRWLFILLIGLSVSIGWGIRGQFGHEYGAALAGALAGMTVSVLSGREDWRARVAYFAFFGAIGFAFGGSMSYMKVQAYAHSSDFASVLYGFACLFVIGFLWAAPAGTAIALPAYLNREELTKFFVPLSFVFVSWYLQDFTRGLLRSHSSEAWFTFFADYQTSAILAAIVAIAFFFFGRRYWGVGTALILYMAIGWLAGDLFFVKLLHLRMSPPRADTWASCLGMVVGIVICCWRRGLGGIGFATVSAGMLGGIGFPLGTAVKLLVMRSGFQTNWHSVMEQTQGLLLGFAIAIPFAMMVRRAPRVTDTVRLRRWTEIYSVVFVLWLVPYLNFRFSPQEWVGEVKNLQPQIYGISISGYWLPDRGFVGWLDVAALIAGIAMTLLLILHLRRPLAVIPATSLGKGQLLYVAFLWAITAMNFMLVIPRFTPLRLVTEWFITLNAAFCTLVLVYTCTLERMEALTVPPDWAYAKAIRRMAMVGLIGAIVVPPLGTAVKFACWGDRYAGASVIDTGPLVNDPIRFGPRNTNNVH